MGNLQKLLIDQGQQLNRLEGLLTLQKRALTFDEALLLTGGSKSYLYKLTAKGEIPHYKPNGKRIYFDRVELENWLLRNRIKTNQEISQETTDYVVTGKKQGKEEGRKDV